MQAFNFKKQLCGIALLLLMSVGASVQAATLSVNCGGKYGLTSINAAIKALQSFEESQGPNTINVSGACHENILIKNMDRLTLNAVNGASITDASNGNSDVIAVDNSLGFTLTGFTITGGDDAVDCEYGSHCLLNQNTIQGAASDAVGIYPLTTAKIDGGTLQNSGNGLLVRGDVIAAGVTIQGNVNGVVVQDGGRFLFRVSGSDDGVAFPTQSVSRNNQQQGILAIRSATVVCRGCTVSGNGADGVHLDLAATATFGGFAAGTVTGNAGSGVSVGDLANATFIGTTSVTGNGQPEIACNAPTAVTRGAIAAAGAAANTNCAN
jgi:Right handed beta helix region